MCLRLYSVITQRQQCPDWGWDRHRGGTSTVFLSTDTLGIEGILCWKTFYPRRLVKRGRQTRSRMFYPYLPILPLLISCSAHQYSWILEPSPSWKQEINFLCILSLMDVSARCNYLGYFWHFHLNLNAELCGRSVPNIYECTCTITEGPWSNCLWANPVVNRSPVTTITQYP